MILVANRFGFAAKALLFVALVLSGGSADADGWLHVVMAGGGGSRLRTLTSVQQGRGKLRFGRDEAKPNVPFGRYNLVDLTISPLRAIGENRIAVLTQYHPEGLEAHLRAAHSKVISAAFRNAFPEHPGGVMVRRGTVGTPTEYRGTAHAVLQNFDLVERTEAEYVGVHAGDHVARIAVDRAMQHLVETGADVVVVAKPWPAAEATGLGVFKTQSDGRVMKFVEKEKNVDKIPRIPIEGQEHLALASLGIYFFKASVLRDLKARADKSDQLFVDFGHDVIPRLIEEGHRVDIHPHEGYWRDVGTIDGLWRANMDLVGPDPRIRFDVPPLLVDAYGSALPSNWARGEVTLKDSKIAPAASLEDSSVARSVVSQRVRIEASRLQGVVLHPDAVIEGSELRNVIVGSEARIRGLNLGSNPEADQKVLREWLGKTRAEQHTVVDAESGETVILVPPSAVYPPE